MFGFHPLASNGSFSRRNLILTFPEARRQQRKDSTWRRYLFGMPRSPPPRPSDPARQAGCGPGRLGPCGALTSPATPQPCSPGAAVPAGTRPRHGADYNGGHSRPPVEGLSALSDPARPRRTPPGLIRPGRGKPRPSRRPPALEDRFGAAATTGSQKTRGALSGHPDPDPGPCPCPCPSPSSRLRRPPALTGLGRVAVHGIGRDVHLLHARVLPARQGPHGRGRCSCSPGPAPVPAPPSAPHRGRPPRARCGGRLPAAAGSAAALRLWWRGAPGAPRTILRPAQRQRLYRGGCGAGPGAPPPPQAA